LINKYVIVNKSLEGSADHFVAEIIRKLKSRDLRGEHMFEPEVTGSPSNRLPVGDEARRHAVHRLLPGILHTKFVKIDTAREIKTMMRRGGDNGRKFNKCHNSIHYKKMFLSVRPSFPTDVAHPSRPRCYPRRLA